jgi:hypothetical protein
VTPPRVRAQVAESRRKQGLTERVEDAIVLAQLAASLLADEPAAEETAEGGGGRAA